MREDDIASALGNTELDDVSRRVAAAGGGPGRAAKSRCQRIHLPQACTAPRDLTLYFLR